MAYPRFQLSRSHKKARRTSGNITLNSTAWANVDTGLDLVLLAEVGDDIEVGVSGRFENEAVWAVLDVVSVVSGVPVNSWATDGAPDAAGNGVSSWIGPISQYASTGGSIIRTLVSGDLSGGTVTLRLRYRTLTAANRTLNATTTSPLAWWAKNIGPVDPN